MHLRVTQDVALASSASRREMDGVEVGDRWRADVAPGAFGGAPYGATILVRGVPEWVIRAHVDAATWAFGGAPYVATILVRGVPKWEGGP